MVKHIINILLIEDDLDIAAGIGEYLQSTDTEVDYAYSVKQALYLIEAVAFDILILDINLPDGSGIDLCYELKQLRELSAPIIFLTANDLLESKLLGFEYGAIDYIVKPFSLAELKARVTAALIKTRQSESLLLKVGGYDFDINKALLSIGDKSIQLHVTGSIIINELLLNYPKPVSKKRLYSLLWPNEVPKSDPLRAHIHQLRRVCLTYFGDELIETIRGVGYKFRLNKEP